MNTNHEKTISHPEAQKDTLADIRREQSEKLQQQHESAGEHLNDANEGTSERARAEALEAAVSIDKVHPHEERDSNPSPTRRHTISKNELDKNYQQTMTQVQSQMSPHARSFSKVIHHRVIEKVSDTLGSTVARPNAMLAGAIGAFLVTLALYLIAKNFGYRLSGSETIAGFIVGWIAGLLFDYLKVMITGKHS